MKTAFRSFIRKSLAALILLFLAVSISGCGREDTAGRAVISGFRELEDKRIGVTTGSVQALQAEERFPDAQLFYFSTSVDMLNALRTNKIDAYADAEALVKYMMAANPDLTCLDEKHSDGMKAGAIFPKTEQGRKLCDEFSAFVGEIKANGVFDEIRETWFGVDEAKRAAPDLDALPRMITWADGTRYLIDGVTDVRLAARMRSGGLGDRYTVHINGRKSYLYFERSLNLTDANLGRWFVVRR